MKKKAPMAPKLPAMPQAMQAVAAPALPNAARRALLRSNAGHRKGRKAAY